MADHHITSDNGRQLLGNRAKQSSRSDEGYQQKKERQYKTGVKENYLKNRAKPSAK